MRIANVIWGTTALALGILIATGIIPNTATGPRIGLSMALFTMALLILGIPSTVWIIKRTTKPDDYKGTCPVGKVCPACGTFNYNPRITCRSCSADLVEVDEAEHN